jgi:queuine tRNA-ribosyltransferase
LKFELLTRDEKTQARRGRIFTDHGEIQTPIFMPVGTAGTVKGMTQQHLAELGAQIILGNTYHLYLRPGHQLISDLGGLHRFISWDHPILTDSGGFQVFSQSDLRHITEEGVSFQSHLDGSSHFLSPERSIDIQMHLGADIIMAFDECTPYPCDFLVARESMERTLRWAARSRQAFSASERKIHPHDQWLFGIGQGGIFAALRRDCIDRLIDLDFPGYAVGGLSVGESKSLMYEMVYHSTASLPLEKPRYLMGVGTPLDLLESIAAGVDMFDCVLPTRNGRNGWLFTRSGHIVIKNARFARDPDPIDPHCRCMVCRTYSRAYLRHLFQSHEILASVLNTYHNLYFYLDMVGEIRDAISSCRFAEYAHAFKAAYEADSKQPEEVAEG